MFSMFDFGFSKLLLIGIVALVVIGPERLPRVARTLGHLYGRLQRYVTQVKADINREMDITELNKVKTEFESAARSFSPRSKRRLPRPNTKSARPTLPSSARSTPPRRPPTRLP